MTSDNSLPTEETPDWSNLEAELARSFQPAWTRGGANPSPEQLRKWEEQDEHPGDSRLDTGRREFSRKDSKFRAPKRREDRPSQPHQGRGPKRDGGQHDRERRGKGRHPQRHGATPVRPRPPSPSVLTGWRVTFLPDEVGLQGLAKQIKQTARAFSLFDLSRLVLDHPSRYSIQLHRQGGAALFRCVADDSLWLEQTHALEHALAIGVESYYRREVQTVEAVKGTFHCVARCGLSGVLLGPPNHHQYQVNLRRLHAEKFARMPFAAFQAKVQMVRDEAVLQEWKMSQTTCEVFYPLTGAEDAEPKPIRDRATLRRDFQERHGAEAVVAAGEDVTLPGAIAIGTCAPEVSALVRQEWDKCRRFPIAMAHACGKVLSAAGLHLFKAHDNITYVGVSRPHGLDRQSFPVSDSLARLLTLVEERPGISRAELRAAWESQPDEASGLTTFAADLTWLLHQGHLIDFAGRGLESAISLKPPKAADRPSGEKKPATSKPAAAKPESGSAKETAGASETSSPAALPEQVSEPTEEISSPSVDTSWEEAP